MRLSSTPSTNILLPVIAIMWPPKSVWSASGEAWMTILRDSMPTSPRSLMGIEIRGREGNHGAGPPAGGVQDFNRVAACLGGPGQLRPGVRPVTVQVQGSTHHHDPAVTAVIRSTHSTYVFVFDVVGEGNCRLAR